MAEVGRGQHRALEQLGWKRVQAGSHELAHPSWTHPPATSAALTRLRLDPPPPRAAQTQRPKHHKALKGPPERLISLKRLVAKHHPGLLGGL
mgnify:CR=1 FL=1